MSKFYLLTNALRRIISAAMIMNTSHLMQSKEVIALDADDHLLRPTLNCLIISEMRLFQAVSLQRAGSRGPNAVQVNRVQTRDTFLCAPDE